MSNLSKQEVRAHLAQNIPIPGAAPILGLSGGFGAMAGNPVNTPFTQAKRLYVGNVPQSANEDDLKRFFRHQFITAGFAPPDTEVVQSVQIKYDRNFAFIELDEAELATKGLGFDGISFQDHTLKVRRPRDYQGPETNLGDSAGYIRGIVSTNVPDTPNKIFIGGLPSALTEDQVKELVGYFGELKAFHLVKDNSTNVSKGFAFYEYLDPNKTDDACRALNGKEIGGKTLLVQRAHLGSRNFTQTTYELGNSESVLGCLLNLSMPVTSTLHQNELSATPEPTPVLVLLNMVCLEDLLKEEERRFLEEDVRNECEQFGKVLKVVAPGAETEEELERVKGLGKVFVQFENTESAQEAQKSLALRKYHNRCVLTTYIDEDLFLGGFYDGKEDVGTEKALEKLQQHFKNETAQGNGQNKSQSYHNVPPPSY